MGRWLRQYLTDMSQISLKVLFFQKPWVVWLFRMLFSINLLICGLNYPVHNYPLVVLILMLIAYWLDIGKLSMTAILILLYTLYLNCDHYIYSYTE